MTKEILTLRITKGKNGVDVQVNYNLNESESHLIAIQALNDLLQEVLYIGVPLEKLAPSRSFKK